MTATKYTKKDIKGLYRAELVDYESKNSEMTAGEKKGLCKWVADGGSPYDNPWGYCKESGHTMDYLMASQLIEDMQNNPDDYIYGAEDEADVMDDDNLFIRSGLCSNSMDKTMTQIKFTLESDIVAAFKARCIAEGISMTAATRHWMVESRPSKNAGANVSTRPNRRKAVQDIIGLLAVIMDSEAEYRDSIPEQFAQRFEAAELACDMLAEAINCLEEAF